MPRPVHPPEAVRAWVAAGTTCLTPPDRAGALGRRARRRLVGYLMLEHDWLHSLYVEPELTGQGIGAALLDLATALRPQGLGLWVFESNEGAAGSTPATASPRCGTPTAATTRRGPGHRAAPGARPSLAELRVPHRRGRRRAGRAAGPPRRPHRAHPAPEQVPGQAGRDPSASGRSPRWPGGAGAGEVLARIVHVVINESLDASRERMTFRPHARWSHRPRSHCWCRSRSGPTSSARGATSASAASSSALAQFAHRDEVEVIWQSFELDPGAAARRGEVGAGYAERLAREVRHQPRRRAADARLDDGHRGRRGPRLPLRPRRAANTFDAHQVIHLAAERGVQDTVKERLMRAYFTEGEAVGDRATLVRARGARPAWRPPRWRRRSRAGARRRGPCRRGAGRCARHPRRPVLRPRPPVRRLRRPARRAAARGPGPGLGRGAPGADDGRPAAGTPTRPAAPTAARSDPTTTGAPADAHAPDARRRPRAARQARTRR